MSKFVTLNVNLHSVRRRQSMVGYKGEGRNISLTEPTTRSVWWSGLVLSYHIAPGVVRITLIDVIGQHFGRGHDSPRDTDWVFVHWGQSYALRGVGCGNSCLRDPIAIVCRSSTSTIVVSSDLKRWQILFIQANSDVKHRDLLHTCLWFLLNWTQPFKSSE